jgi:hypothetical protein
VSVQVSLKITTGDLTETLLVIGDLDALWDQVSPRLLNRLVDIGAIRRDSNGPPQLTTLGQILLERVKAGELIPDLEHLP